VKEGNVENWMKATILFMVFAVVVKLTDIMKSFAVLTKEQTMECELLCIVTGVDHVNPRECVCIKPDQLDSLVKSENKIMCDPKQESRDDVYEKYDFGKELNNQ
jgi:hypothetical protein